MNVFKQHKELRKKKLKHMLDTEGYSTRTLAKFGLVHGVTIKKIFQYLRELGIEESIIDRLETELSRHRLMRGDKHE